MINSLKNKGKKFWDIIRPRKWYGFLPIILVVGCVFIVSLAFIDVSFAQNAAEVVMSPMESFRNALISFVGGIFLWFATKFIALTVFCLRFTIEIAAYNNYIGSGAVQLGWVLVRDIANMFFVIILMMIAFGTVLGLEQYEWKKLLPKFILAAILVNFSRVICGVIIDAAHVFTMTFISGVAATAGGNLINALNLDKVLDFTIEADPTAMKSLNILATTIIATIFSFAALVIIAAYTFVFLARAVTLWVLIILSPLAFIFSIIPQTKSYATQWWSEFTKNVLIAPILAFFLWLSFAIAGSGSIHDEFQANSVYKMKSMSEYQEAAGKDLVDSNISDFLKANNLAGFLIAFALLMAGIKVSQQLGAAGSGMLAKAGGAATKFAMAASGVTAAKWAGRGALKGAKKAGKFAAMKTPILGGDAWKRRGGRIMHGKTLGIMTNIGRAAGARNTLAKGARDKILKKYGHTGLGKFAANASERVLETSSKADTRVASLKARYEDEEKGRRVRWGAGTTVEGKSAGEEGLKLKTEEEEGRIATRDILSSINVQQLRDAGKHEKADQMESENNAIKLEETQKLTKNIPSSNLSTAAINLANDRDSILAQINEKGETEDLLKKEADITLRISGLLTSAYSRSNYDGEQVMGKLVTNFTGDSQDSKGRLLSAFTGINTDGEGDSQETDRLMKIANTKLQKNLGSQGEVVMKNLFTIGVSIAEKEGNAGLMNTFGHGIKLEDPNDLKSRQAATIGIGSGVGKFDSEGVERAPGDRDLRKTDKDTLDYSSQRLSFAKASNADGLINKDKDGNVRSWNEDTYQSTIEKIKQSGSKIEARRQLSLLVRQDLGSDKVPTEMKKQFIKDLDGSNADVVKEIENIFYGSDFAKEEKAVEVKKAEKLIVKDSSGNTTGWSADNLNKIIEQVAQATSPEEIKNQLTPAVRDRINSNKNTPEMKKELFDKLKNKLDDRMLQEAANIIGSVKMLMEEEKKADALINKNSSGDTTGWNADDFNEMIKRVGRVTDPAEFKSQFSPTVRDRINSNETTPEMKRELFDKFKEKLDKKIMKEAVKTFNSLMAFVEEDKIKQKEKDRLDKSSGMEHHMIDLEDSNNK